MAIIKTNVLTPNEDRSVRLLRECYLELKGTKIMTVSGGEIVPDKECDEVIDLSDKLCLPGFIDLHNHLSQYRVRGKHSAGLLPWLEKYIFAEELKGRDESYTEAVANEFFSAMLKAGTTTAVIYTAPFVQACDTAFKVAKDYGFRTIMGDTLMDRNAPSELLRSTEQALEESTYLHEKWNEATQLLEYVFTPRFAPACTEELLQKIGDYAKERNSYIQTHLSENREEVKWVRELFPQLESYTEVYRRFNLLGEKTLLGHAIHLTDKELEIIAQTKSKITHCPDSNFFLHSGIFPLERISKQQIEFGLGSDVGAGTTLSMLEMMRLFIYRQDQFLVSPQDAFYYSTLGSAKLLGKGSLIGSIDEGKEADLVFIELETEGKDAEELLSDLIYLNSEQRVAMTYVAGVERYNVAGEQKERKR